MEENYKLYIHVTPSLKTYVGITKRTVEERWQNGHGYYGSPYFNKAIKKYGWDNIMHSVLLENLSKESACFLERAMIIAIESNNPQYGYNLTNGGDGTGSKRSEEWKKNLSKSLKQVKRSEETKERCREQGRKNSIKISQYTLNGIYISTFESASECERKTNTCKSNILKCCRGERSHANGYVWHFAK